MYGGPSLPIKKNKNKKNKKNKSIKNENKEIEQMKKILFRKKTHKIIMAYDCHIWQKNFLFKKKKKTQNYHGPMSAQSDTYLPCFIYDEIRIFLDHL